MKNLMLILVTICLLLSVGGCYELIATNDKGAIVTGVEALMVRVDEFQNVMTEASAVDLINSEEMKKRNDQIDEIQEMVVAAKETIEESPTLIEAVIKTNQASAPVNPYAPLIDAVLKVIAGAGAVGTVGLGYKASKTVREIDDVKVDLNVVNKKYKAAKRGSERLRIAHPEIAEESFNIVGEERIKVGVG